jgi:biotin-(acetyl-CoA carboxylase) ligase
VYATLKREKITSFRRKVFMGIIIGVSDSGNIIIELENESLKEFGIKEISFA